MTASTGLVVAVTELGSSVEDAAKALAPELRTTAYELKLSLAAGFPAVVLLTVDEAQARAAHAALVRARHRALLCRRADVVASGTMVGLRDFRLDDGGIAPTSDSADVLPFTDLLAVVRASHRVVTETTTEVKERKFRPGMAIATGGMILSKTVTKEVTSRSEDREQVAYLFRRSGERPFILRERSARYAGLGADAAPTALANFTTTLKKLRARAPAAVYDERIMGGRAVRGIPDAIAATDLLAHLIAESARAL